MRRNHENLRKPGIKESVANDQKTNSRNSNRFSHNHTGPMIRPMTEPALPFRDPAFRVELGERVVLQLMTQRDWAWLFDMVLAENQDN